MNTAGTSRGDMTNGYPYEMWIQDGASGTACLTVYGSDARFKVAWNLGGYGFVARVGRFFDQTKTDEQLGWITADWEHIFTKAMVTVGSKPTALADPHPRGTARGEGLRLPASESGHFSLHALDGTLIGTQAIAGPEESFPPLRDPRNGFYVVKPQ